MKKSRILITCAIAAIAITASIPLFAREGAQNCTYTGDGNDYCYTSDGSHNIKVLNCAPGVTDCAY